MAVSPVQLKSFLSKIKEDILDGNSQFSSAFQALLLLELVQRGVLPLASQKDDVVKVAESIRSTAGKTLLGTDSLPKPLLAGSSVMAGMVAERCALLVDNVLDATWLEFSLGTMADARERCQEVDDRRLLAILKIPRDNHLSSEQRKNQLLLVAEGYFLRAASIQPNQPQMWKKALDMVQTMSKHQEEEPLEASYPLENLIRIAESKDNMKRVAELSLRLTESWLSAPMAKDHTISEVFVAPFQAPLETNAEEAKQSLRKCDISYLDADGILWHQILEVRIVEEEELSSIDKLAQDQFTTSKNRGVSSSLSACKAAARSQHLLDTIGKDSWESCASSLRDTILTRHKHVSNKHLDVARHLLVRYMKRLQELARAAALAHTLKSKTAPTTDMAISCWTSLRNFVFPILQSIADLVHWKRDDDFEKDSLASFLKRADESLRGLVKLCALIMVNFIWMQFGYHLDSPTVDILHFLNALLAELFDRLKLSHQDSKNEEGLSPLLKASSEDDESSGYALECAYVSTSAMLHTISNKMPTKKLTDQALLFSAESQKYVASLGQFGTSFFLLASAWSGFQHAPWQRCNVSQARSIVKMARMTIKNAAVHWGRKESTLEKLVLDIAEADAEGGFLGGGLGHVAKKLYYSCKDQASKFPVTDHLHFVRAHCLAGLSKLALSGFLDHGKNDDLLKPLELVSEDFARLSLNEAEMMSGQGEECFYLDMSCSLRSTKSFHCSLARQLVADALMRAGRIMDAEDFLLAAVEETPQDFEAALALGAFRLRTAFFPAPGVSPSSDKAARTQLLKAAKLNPSEASSFALLGFWYEANGDISRAVGCYSKALILEPSQPIAGRGMLRLRSFESVRTICDAAVNTNSPLNGWAWRAIGVYKALIDANDELAVICLQESIRCKDVAFPHNESMSLFYNPSEKLISATAEIVEVWFELASCYWRLGRFSAAIRAFEAARSLAGENLPPAVLVSHAKVLLEAGLVDDSVEAFVLALQTSDISVSQIASYGLGCALLSLTQRDLRDGKASLAFKNLIKAVAVVENAFSPQDATSTSFVCAMKLLGDLHTFGAQLPPHLFSDDDDRDPIERSIRHLRSQVSFIAIGEKYYSIAETHANRLDYEHANALRSALFCDMGTNILIRAQLLSILRGEGHGIASNLALSETILFADVEAAFQQAKRAFRQCISLDPLFAPAWCGFGCAVIGSDPLLAQHSLACAIQLDKAMPDAWSNLAFLYASRNAPEASMRAIQELTQVADTPMMWIGRAAILEREGVHQLDKEARIIKFSQAADAYRAALQVAKEPAALLGLGLRSRIMGFTESKQQSFAYMSEFLGSSSSLCAGAVFLHSAMTIEEAIRQGRIDPRDWKDEMITNALTSIDDWLPAEKIFVAPSKTTHFASESKDGEVVSKLIGDLKDTFEVSQGEIIEPQTQNLQMQIMTNPNDGRLWLTLAKNLAKDLRRMKGEKRPKVILHAIENITLASERAVKILVNQMTMTGGENGLVEAKDVAEAFALLFCVRDSLTELIVDLKKPPEIIPANGYDLQRAIMMNPRSRLAREALSAR